MIVILTALELEATAVREHMTGIRPHHHQTGTIFEIGMMGGRADRMVALAVIGMGTVNAAAITERAITEFQPEAVVFVGIAGSLREWVRLGDVVVATRVYAYHGGRVDDGEFLARPRAWDTAHRLVQLAQHVHRSQAWPVPVHFEPIAAGEVVLNSRVSPESQRLRTHYNDAVAIEMESSGVALAGHLSESTPTITVRGICDLADGTKQATDLGGDWQKTAARNAAAFAVGLAAAIHQTKPANLAATTATPLPVHNTGGNYIGSVHATGSVKIKQKIVTYARRHPGMAALVLALVVAVLGAGGYGIVRVVTGDSPGSNPAGPAYSDPDFSNPSSVGTSARQAINAHDWTRLATMTCTNLGIPPAIDKDLPVELDATLHLDEPTNRKDTATLVNLSVSATFGPGDYSGGHVERQTLKANLHLAHTAGKWCVRDLDINGLNLPE